MLSGTGNMIRSLVLMEKVKPNRVKYHMKHVVSPRFRTPQKMSLNHLHVALHLQISPHRNLQQYLLKPWNVLLRYNHRERRPVKHFAERQDEVISDDNGYALVVYCLNDTWTVHFVTHWT